MALDCLPKLLGLLLKLLGWSGQLFDLRLVVGNQVVQKVNLRAARLVDGIVSPPERAPSSVPVSKSLKVDALGVSTTLLPSERGERFWMISSSSTIARRAKLRKLRLTVSPRAFFLSSLSFEANLFKQEA